MRSLEASWRQYQEAVDSLENQLTEVRRTVGLRTISGKEKVAADIVAYDPVTSRITLNVGSRSGVVAGQAVVCGMGLVGQIQSADPSHSQALLVTSPVLRIGAMIQGTTPVTGLIRGQGPRRLVFELLESSRTYNQGELVVTSIHSERTPPGIPIGIVVQQEPAQEYGIARVIVAPTIDIAQIREVLERPDDPFPIRIFARQDADDVLDASDQSEWLEVEVVEEVAEPETEPSCGEVLRRFKQVLCRSQALFEEKPKKDCDPAPRWAR